MKHSLISLLLLTALIPACTRTETSEAGQENMITEKIEYPVFIKDPWEEETTDWWKENIETSKRLEFVKTIFDWAYSGKVKAYDFITYEPLSVEQVKAIGNRCDTITITETTPPYREKDTVIQEKLDFAQIHKVKFLEEWTYDKNRTSIAKKIIGIAPALTVYADSVEIKGFKPLFWLFFDDRYAKKK